MVLISKKSSYFLERLGTSCCYRLLNGKNTIGRYWGSNIVVNSTYCSREHCTIEVQGNVVKVCDKSTNGTYLNDVQLLNAEEIIRLDTKIGIGVTGVEIDLENDENLYVLVLKSLVLEANRISLDSFKQEVEIIELLDSDDEPDCQNPVVHNGRQIEPNNVEDKSNIEENGKDKSNAVAENGADKSNTVAENGEGKSNTEKGNGEDKSNTEKGNGEGKSNTEKENGEGKSNTEAKNNVEDKIISKKTERPTAENIINRRKSVHVAIDIFGSDIITDMRKDDDFRKVLDVDIKIEPTSYSELLAEPQETANGTNDGNILDLSNDEDFIQSQNYLKEIKQEISNFDNDDGELNNVNNFDENTTDSNDNNSYSPIIEISDDENDMDEEATSWMMKLSQSVCSKADIEKLKKVNENAQKPMENEEPAPNLENNSAMDVTDEVDNSKELSADSKISDNSLLDRADEIDDVEMETAVEKNDKKRKLDADIKKITKKHSKKSTTILLNNTDAPGPSKRTRNAVKWEELDMKTTKVNSSNSKPSFGKDTLDNSQVLRHCISKSKTVLKNREKAKDKPRIDNRPGKLRFSNIPKSISQEKSPEQPMRSILSPKKTTTTKEKTPKKTVRFNDKNTVYTYDSYETTNNLRKIGTAKDAALPEQKVAKMNEQRIMLNNRTESKQAVLNEILSWKFKWLEDRQHEIKGTDNLRPMLHHYDSFETYKNIVYPLMKLEFWVTLEQDNRNRFKNLALRHFETEEIKHVAQKRMILICEEPLIGNNMKLFFEADLVAVEISDDLKVFGYVRCVRFNERRYFDIIIELNWSQKLHEKINILMKNNKPLKITKLSEIRIELGAFEAINSIKNSPLLHSILNPNNIKHSNIDTAKVHYTGYDRLNPIQKQILLKTYLRCLNTDQPTIQLIEGPPGTGKSRVLVNLILQLIYGNESRHQRRKFLICAHSNVAVDVIATKLIHIRNKMEKRKRFTLVRFGNLERMNPCVRQFSLQQCYHRFKQSQNEQAVRNEEIFLRTKIDELVKTNVNGFNNNEIERFSNNLRVIYDSDRKGQINLLKNTQIICSTVSSCVNLRNMVSNFDVCIIDEATQCNEPWSLLPIELGINSLILAGDTNQLPATCISTLAKDYNYGKSLFTRIKETLEDNSEIPTLLQQYRMHPEIAKFPNNYFYKNLLENDASTSNIKLMVKPYSILNLNFSQNQNNDSSISNCMEAKFIIKLIENLTKIMSIDHYSYGIITPYSQHRDNIYMKLRDLNVKNFAQIEINTIDAFQGKEKDVIIISNARTEGVGFLRDPARLNVSLTRARKCLILCGNYQQLEGVPVWKALISDAKKRGVYYNFESNVLENFEKAVISNIFIPNLIQAKQSEVILK